MDFEIQTRHRIRARGPGPVLINKKNRIYHLVDFAAPADHEMKMKENEKMNKYRDLARELKKVVERVGDGDGVPFVFSAFEMVLQDLVKRTEDQKNPDYPDCSTFMIS